MIDYTKNLNDYMTEEEANAVMLEAAREEYPNVPAHITVCMFLLRESLHDLAGALEDNPGCGGLIQKVEDSLVAAGTVHFSIVDAFNKIYGDCGTVQ